MPQEKIEEIMTLVRKHFQFLFERGRVIFADYDAKHFGNFAVVLEANELRVRVFCDRGSMDLHLGPLWAIAGWSGEPWYNINAVTAFLTQKQVLVMVPAWEEVGQENKQLGRLAKALQFYYDQITELFRPDTFREKKESLDLVAADILSLYLEPVRRAELQILEARSAKFWQ